MTSEEAAWCLREFLDGRTQKAIGEQFNVTGSTVCTALMRFHAEWGSSGPDFIHIMNYDERRDAYFAQAYRRFIKTGKHPVEPEWRTHTMFGRGGMPEEDRGYWAARREHAWLLRAEGLKLREIALRLGGISRDRVSQMIRREGWSMSRALRKTRVTVSYP
jgi:hypothetical protein